MFSDAGFLLLQTGSHYEALKCFMHGFLAVAGVPSDPAESTPFDLSRLDVQTQALTNQVIHMAKYDGTLARYCCCSHHRLCGRASGISWCVSAPAHT